jgi:hypothetical protein
MKTADIAIETEVDVWLRILYPGGKMTPQSARAVLNIKLSTQDKRRLRMLLQKGNAGTLSPEEEKELDGFERAGDMLAILQARARGVLKSNKPQS